MLFIKDLEVKNKKVFLRVDFNVPLDENKNIQDDTRIRAVLPTIQYLAEQGAMIVAASHLGRPKGKFVPELSLKPVAEKLAALLPQEVILAPGVTGERVTHLKRSLTPDRLLLLENLRFDPGEKENDSCFAQHLAEEIDCYVNDAFGVCHRAHASVVAITQYVPKAAAGFLLKKEIDYLNKAFRSPEKPYVAILGGAKVSEKIPVIENLLNKADTILIGGAMAYTFLKAKGEPVGGSKVEDDKIETARHILDTAEKAGVRLELPLDHVAAREISQEAETKILKHFDPDSDWKGLDIGPETQKLYAEASASAKTIFWNGPMGVFEVDQFAQGTIAVGKAVASSNALSIVGGGDSVSAVFKAGVQDGISHISTGGGASLEYLANETLPGIEALSES
ncbi:MAG: phosphoglycerate kinase [Candidatus Aminicenantes bacterium]|nr:phosphoglycerate kinase [Candidatus Aminicenantes bacterium]